MQTAVCTLYEGDYHYGVGVLTNSIYNHGFRGVVWVGYRGNLPPWAKPCKDGEGYQEFSVAEGCTIRFVQLTTPKHLGFYKPDFMWQLLDRYCPEVEALFYFDPDIVNKFSWDFYQRWVSRGIALCGDAWYHVPADHPRRLAWKEFAESNGFVCERQLDRNYNSGFVGVPQSYKSILLLWQKLIEIGSTAGHSNIKELFATRIFDHYPYLDGDQTYLNLALMLTNYPLSTVGPEGMDFLPGGNIMSHAAATIKPWRKKLIIDALKGNPPTMTDKLYWQHTQAPIQVYSTSTYSWNRFAVRCGSAMGRFMRRSLM